MEVLKMTLGDGVSSRVDIVDGCVIQDLLCSLCFLCFCKKKRQEFDIGNIQAIFLWMVSEIETISSTYKSKGNSKQSACDIRAEDWKPTHPTWKSAWIQTLCSLTFIVFKAILVKCTRTSRLFNISSNKTIDVCSRLNGHFAALRRFVRTPWLSWSTGRAMDDAQEPPEEWDLRASGVLLTSRFSRQKCDWATKQPENSRFKEHY